jgi:hypothetical protein
MLGAGGDSPDELLAGAAFGADVAGRLEFTVAAAAMDAG